MSNIHVDRVGNMAVVECEGRFVRSDEAFKLRDAVKEVVFQQPASIFLAMQTGETGLV